MNYRILFGVLVVMLLAVTVMGCKKESKIVPPEVAAAPAKDVRQKTVEKTDDILVRGETDLKLVNDLKCDVQGDKGIFSFRLVNPTSTAYTLRPVGLLEADLNPLKIKVNGRVFDYTYCKDGDVMTLAPGASKTCTREFIPTEITTGKFVIRTGVSELGVPAENRLLISSSDFTTELVFKCE